MSSFAIRTSAASLAIAATLGTLAGIELLSSPRADTPVVAMPTIMIVASRRALLARYCAEEILARAGGEIPAGIEPLAGEMSLREMACAVAGPRSGPVADGPEPAAGGG